MISDYKIAVGKTSKVYEGRGREKKHIHILSGEPFSRNIYYCMHTVKNFYVTVYNP
jgi:hypothetical protein